MVPAARQRRPSSDVILGRSPSAPGGRLRRRELIALLGGAVAAPLYWRSAARAQTTDRVRRIGWLHNVQADSEAGRERSAAVRQELARFGWLAGRNLQLDERWGVLSDETAQRAAAELLALKPDAILCSGSPGLKALQQATRTVPIVFCSVAEPVDQGFVQSLARPGANITGFAFLERTVGAKWLALLTELAPKVKRVAFIFGPKAAPYAHFYYESIAAAAGKTGVQTESDPANDPADLEPIVARLGADGGAIFNPDAFTGVNLQLAIDLAKRYRAPAIYANVDAVKAGGLIAYSPDLIAQYRQSATYLDRILKGEKPADLPVQQPTKFQFDINLGTAKALGIAVPQSLVAQADNVVE